MIDKLFTKRIIHCLDCNYHEFVTITKFGSIVEKLVCTEDGTMRELPNTECDPPDWCPLPNHKRGGKK